MSINDYSFSNNIREYLKYEKFDDFTTVQKNVFSKYKKYNNMIVQSPTGSGKTLAFLLPLVENLKLELQECQVLILTPTRELSNQIFNVLNKINEFYDNKISISKLFGGTDRQKEISKLKKSQPQVVIGTPGKVFDMSLKEKLLNFDYLNTLVIDEADMCLESGFTEHINHILDLKLSKHYIFSATIPQNLSDLLIKHFDNPYHIKVNKLDLNISNIEHILIQSKKDSKDKDLIRLVKHINPYLCIIFVNTKNKIPAVVSELKNNSIKVGVLHGGLEQRERKRVMKDIHNLKYQYIVASDIASRGIDIEGVSHIINYELPDDFEFYIHRSGRTGRSNHTGICFSLVDFEDVNYFKSLENKNIIFKRKKFVKDDLIDVNKRVNRQNRVRPELEEHKQAKKIVKKSNKVKPGYKKKYNQEIKKVAGKLRRTKRK